MILDVSCNRLAPILRIAGYIFNIMQWIIPIIIIIVVIIDVVRIIMNPDEKNSKDSLNRILKRLLYAIIIFIIPLVVKLLFKIVDKGNINSGYSGSNTPTSWISCFNQYFN